ncbi:alpha-beta hydrolase superfamily lysophospholipase [Rhodoblastus sphagnicola]|nr:alpha/beta fold hydrolase [Rhodoblastus sphagnicola]MBB4198164.1 alpha-beta hydrolase superfamily lysophospholipase [Rhodoblastus sphagnicola]
MIWLGLALFAAAVPALVWLAGSAMVWGRVPVAAVPAVAPARDLTLTAADGITLAATFWPGRRPGSPGIVLLHGVFADRTGYAAQAGWLARQGFAVLTVDLRGHGGSGAAAHSFGLSESRDARAAFDWLKARQANAPVGVIGISLGGAAALLGDDGPLPAQALALVCVFPDIDAAIRNRVAAHAPEPLPSLLTPLLKYQSYPRFGVGPERLRPIEVLRKVTAPVLIVGGGADAYTPPEESRAMLAAAAGPKELLLLDGMDHAAATWADTPAYRERLKAFFVGALGAP